MDLALYARVARRFWILLAAGTVLAIVLAALSIYRVTPHGLTYRKQQVWQSESTLLLTQAGFPWGRAVTPTNGSASQLGALSTLYSQFANSDAVRLAMLRHGAPSSWKLAAAPDATTPGLPIVDLFGQANTPAEAVKALLLGRSAFLDYVTSRQQAAAIPSSQRVQIQTLSNATKPVVITPRKKTLPIVVFVAVMTLTVGLIFALENARPRRPVVAIAIGGGDSPAPEARVGSVRRH
jgi:hypothetical protein